MEQLALDSSALLLTELMMAERRGWEAWRTLNQLLARSQLTVSTEEAFIAATQHLPWFSSSSSSSSYASLSASHSGSDEKGNNCRGGCSAGSYL